VKTLVGISQILSLASSSFTEEHASSSGPQWRATLPAVSRQQRNRPTPWALAWLSQVQPTSPAISFVLHLKNQHFRAWQHIYVGVFPHTDTDNPTYGITFFKTVITMNGKSLETTYTPKWNTVFYFLNNMFFLIWNPISQRSLEVHFFNLMFPFL
jgi:hypothetical protein